MKTEIIAIIDSSGSMGSIINATINGFDGFIAEQASLPGEARVSLVQFDSVVRESYSGVHIAEVQPLGRFYTVQGMTAMHDGICYALDIHGRRITDEGWADNVIVVILTDGQENQSRRYIANDTQRMIDHAKRHGWSFVFLAANQDAFKVGASMGIDKAHTYNFAASDAGTRAAYQNMSASTTALRGTTF